MTKPIIIESLRRRDLIIDTKLLIPGMVSVESLVVGRKREQASITQDVHHAGINTSQRGSLSRELRASFVCLTEDHTKAGIMVWQQMATHFRISSVIRCELSILPRSASRESAAEDLYALIDFRIQNGP